MSTTKAGWGAGLLCLILGMPAAKAGQQVFFEDWVFGQGSWSVSNGSWAVGEPTAGPASAYSDQFCAGTNLDGLYSPNTNSRLASPLISLPSLTTGERLELRFRHWFRFASTAYGTDYGFVEVYRTSTGAWETISGNHGLYSPLWTRSNLDLTAYAGEQIRLGFRMVSNHRDEEHGWFLDDIEVLSFVPHFENPSTFEGGIGDHGASNGQWQVGVPTHGPDSTPSGQACAGTRLHGNYLPSTSSRLFGPRFLVDVDVGQVPELHVDQWFRLASTAYGTDYARIQIRDLTNGGGWTTLQSFYGVSSGPGGWQHQVYDLSAYAGHEVQVGFLFEPNHRDEDAGWYVDNVQVSGIKDHLFVEVRGFGQGLAGSGDIVPRLDGRDGRATGGYAVRADRMLGGAFVIIWAGLGKIQAPFKGGTFYVDLGQTHYSVPFRAQGAPGVPGAGAFSFQGPGVSELEGMTITSQVTVLDAGAPAGVALSNGLDLVIRRR